MLKGKVALVTGAGRGIGRETALAMAREGARVALLARSRKEIERLVDKIGDGAMSVPCDVSDPQAVERAVAIVHEEFKRVDVLVNNAGIFLDATLLETELQDWNRVLAVNVTGAFLVTKAVLPAMIERREGRIINIASSAGKKGYKAQAAYCASKHAMLGMAKALALEVKEHGIHVHNVCPGGVDTTFIAGTRLGERLEGQVMIAPADIAAFCVFLAKQPGNVDVEEIEIRRFSP
jgi:NAD(P)-dependent dehydrogenase (short-subunit alcohol dehydrogenase family)